MFRSHFRKIKDLSYKLRLPLLGLLGVTVISLIIFARFNQKPPKVEETPENPPLKVKVLKVGQDQLTQQTVGTVKNLTSITLVAQTAGPVDKTYVVEGKQVKKGAWIAHQSTAYGTGNVLTVQRQIAQKNYQLSDESFKNTVEVVAKNRELADKNRENIEELRKISAQSIDGTKKVIDVNKQIISKIESDLNAMSATGSADVVQGLRVQLLTYQNILNSSEAALRNLEYQTNTNNPPTKIADITRDLVYKTTELQLKSAEIGREIAGLSVKAARITEGLSRVAAPFAGKIERLYVQPGQYVTPGTPIAKIKGDTQLCLVVEVSAALATQVSPGTPLKITVKDREFTLPITHISSSPTSGKLYEILAQVPAEFSAFIPEDSSVDVQLPTSSVSRVEGYRFLPLDAVFITNTSKYIFVAEGNIARKHEVKTAEIMGDQVEITDGIELGDEVILDRRVTEGQKVDPQINVNELGNTSS